MFYWIQTYLTKHFKWILVILLFTMIISFVFTIGNFSPLGGGNGPKYREQPFLGYDLSSAKDQEKIFGAGQISLSLIYPSYFGQPSGGQVQDYSLSRVAFLHIADEIGLPGPTKEEFKAHVQKLTGFMDFSTQGFDQTRFTAFVDSLKAGGLTEAYVTNIIEDDFRINKLRDILQGPNHILPFEATNAAQATNTEWTLETAKINYVDFSIDIAPSEEDLNTYFENNKFRYLVDAKTKASYILFDPNKQIDNEYQPEAGEKSIHFFTNKARYQTAVPTPKIITNDDGTIETPEAPEVTLADVEPQIIQELRLARANKETQKIAGDFAYHLFDKEIENGSAEFEAAIAAAGVSLKSLVSYPRSTVIMQDGLTVQTLNQVFGLNDSRYYSDPIQNNNKYVVLIYQGEEAAYTPEYPEVQEKVKADYLEGKKREMFVEKGAEIKKAISNAMTGGDTFEAAAKAQNLDHAAFDSFKRAQQIPEGLAQGLLAHLDSLNKGDLSDSVITSTDGTIIFVVEKIVPELNSDSEELKTYLESQSGRVSNVEPIISDFMTRELTGTALAREEI
jgi:peptidyl-prolyl cis-trans isomerase D